MSPTDSSRILPSAAGAARRPDDLPDNSDSSGVPPRSAPLPQSMADAVRRVCEHATRHNFGRTVYEATPTERGVEVRLSSWPRMREALFELQDHGWVAREDETFHPWERHGSALVVTGRLPRSRRRRRPVRVVEAQSARCKNCSQEYDPADKSDPTWGAFVGPRYCGYCGAQEARIIAANMGAWG